MNPPPDTGELVSRYFDSALSPGEEALLATRLRDSPAAAALFVQLARTESLLSGPVKSSRRPRLTRWLIGLGAAAAALAAATVLLPPPRSAETMAQIPALPTPDLPAPPPALGSLRTVKPLASAATPRDLDALWKDFHVPVDPHGQTVPETLTALEAAIRDANYLMRPALDSLRFTVGESLVPGDPDPVIRSPLTAPMSIATCLAICSEYRQVFREPGHVPCGRIFVPDENPSALSTRTFGVRPDFLTPPQRLSNLPEVAPSDPFTPAPGSPLPDALRILEEYYGVPRADPAHSQHFACESARFEPSSGRLTISRAPTLLLDRVEHFSALLAEPSPFYNYFVSVKLVENYPTTVLAGATEAAGIALTDPEFQESCRALSRSRATVHSLPTAILRKGQSTSLASEREIPMPPAPGGQDYTFDWIGYRITLQAEPDGEFTLIRGKADIGRPIRSAPGLSLLVPQPAPGVIESAAAGVEHCVTGFDLWLTDGQTAAFTLDLPGTRSAMCLTVTRIDPAGQPLPEQR